MWKHPYRVAILTASDKAAAGQRTDASGPLLRDRLQSLGARIVAQSIVPDDIDPLRDALATWADSGTVDLILTTGGTGLAPRDNTPEATLAIATKIVPGIPEAMRAHSMALTHRAMLTRGVAVLRGATLIINLPGSPKAVSESLDAIEDTLEHALETLRGGQECAR